MSEEKVSMSLDQIIKLDKKGSARRRGRGRGRGGRGGLTNNRGRGGNRNNNSGKSPGKSGITKRGSGIRSFKRGRGGNLSSSQIAAAKRLAIATNNKRGRNNFRLPGRGRGNAIVKDARENIQMNQGLRFQRRNFRGFGGMRSDSMVSQKSGGQGRGQFSSRGRGRFNNNILRVNVGSYRGRSPRGGGRGNRGRGGGIQDRSPKRRSFRGRGRGGFSNSNINAIRQQIRGRGGQNNFVLQRSDFGHTTGRTLNDRFSGGGRFQRGSNRGRRMKNRSVFI